MAEKLNGSWLMESLDGQVTEWLKYEDIGFASRQAMWLASYGAGTVKVDSVIEGDTYYTQREVDQWNIFRSQVKLDGKRQPMLFYESHPMAPLKNLEIEGVIEGDKIKNTMYKPDGTLFSKSSRYVSEDGETMFTDITFPAGEWGGEEGGECTMQFKHKRQPEARLSAEVVTKDWFKGGVLLADATEEAGTEKQKGISTPLEDMFTSAESLVAELAAVNRDPKVLGEKATKEEKEGSPNEWTIKNETPGGNIMVYEQKVDLEACTLDVTTTRDGNLIGTWHFKAVSGPVRLQCWNTMDKDVPSTVSSINECQRQLDKVRKHGTHL